MNDRKIRLYDDVDFLTSIRPFRNFANPQSLQMAADYIIVEFEKTNLEVSVQKWKVDNEVYCNVIASYNPHADRRLVVGAHYDVYYNQPGADDNASGVAALLETARILAGRNPNIDYRIDFVAFSLEEPPNFGKKTMGSFIHAQSLLHHGTDVIGMISYEMMGYYPGNKNTRSGFPEGTEIVFPDSDKFIGVISTKKHRDFQFKFYEYMIASHPDRAAFVCFPEGSRGPSLSDNRNYWHFGYPALMLNNGPSSGKNPNYHKLSDTIDTLDFDVLSEVTTACAEAITRF